MLPCYRGFFLLLLIVLPGWVAGQAVPLDGFGVQLKADDGTCHLPGGGYQLRYGFREEVRGPVRIFRHTVLDARQRQRHQRDLKLGGDDPKLVSTGINPRAALYRFQCLRTPDGDAVDDSTVTAVLDTTGRVLSLRRRATTKYQEPSEFPLAVGADSLLLAYQFGYARKEIQLECLNLQQRTRWLQTIRAHKTSVRLINFTADADYAWLVVLDDFLSRQATCTAYCVELKSGRITSAHDLDYGDEKRLPASLILKPDHSLFVLGSSFRDLRVRWHRDKPFAVTLPAVCDDPTAAR